LERVTRRPDQWVADYNFQSHWAHRERQDGRLSPAAVLDRGCGQLFTLDDLERVETPYQSPQPPLWAWEPGEWLSVVRVAPYAPRQPRPIDPSWHLPLPMVDDAELGAG
jgi:hypothetical protein